MYLYYYLLLLLLLLTYELIFICISPIKRTTRKIRNLASAELCATSKYEVVVVGYLLSSRDFVKFFKKPKK